MIRTASNSGLHWVLAILVLTQVIPKPAKNQAEFSQMSSPKRTSFTLDSIYPGIGAGAVQINAGREVGSGSVLSKNRVLTCLHVVKRSPKDIQIRLSDLKTTLPASILKSDPQKDLALLRVETGSQLPFLVLSKDISSGPLFAIGSPFGKQGSVSQGKFLGNIDNGLYQFDMVIHPGHSGGPVVNRFGDQVAIACGVEKDPSRKNISYGRGRDDILKFVGEP